MGKAICLNKAAESLRALTVESFERRLESELGVSLRVAMSMEAARVEQLTAREQLHLETLGNDRRLMSWLTGRAALKSLLASLGDPAETMEIEFPHRRYSLTHSGNYSVAVGSSSDQLIGIGVDLEVHRPVRRETARVFLDEREQAWLEACPETSITKQLLRLWTVKESLFKSDPENGKRWFSDYRIQTPSAQSGLAYLKDASSAEFRYASFEFDEGFLSAAVHKRRSNDA
jgi:4'-phosphopantetheinyl transferase EntD